MSAMGTIFGGPLAQAIGWALLHLLWQGVLVAAILAATLALLRRQSANARYLASCGALVLIVVLSFVTAYRAYDPIRSVASTSSASFPSSAPEPGVAVPIEMAAAADVIIPESSNRLAALATLMNSYLSQIVIAWLIGVTLLASRLVVGFVGANRLAVKNTRPAEEQWERAMQRIAETLQLRRTIRLLESAAVEVPTVIGWLRPVVLLPVASLSGLSTDQIEMILAHELAHIRRHDFIVNLLQSTVETLFFYQPAVWWISRRVRVEREHCCDDLAVSVFGDPIRYARALTRFEELRIDAAQTVLAASGGSLLVRIRRLVTSHAESANWSSRWAAGASLLTVIAALVITPSLPIFAKNEPPAPPAPARPAAPAYSVVEVTPTPEADEGRECDSSHVADHIESDVDLDDIDDDIDVDDESEAHAAAAAVAAVRPMRAMRPVRAPRAEPLIHVNPAIAPMFRGVTPEAIASAVAQGVRGGIDGGVLGAIDEDLDLGDDEDRKLPENGKLSVDDLISLRTSGVTPKYIEEMRGMGLGNLTLNEIRAMRIQGVTPEYVRSLRAAGVEVTTVRNVIAMRIQGVTGEWIAGMRAAGYSKLSTNDLISMRIQGVTPRYVKEMADAGYKGLEAKDLIALRIHGVTPEFVKALADAGYANLTAKDLTRLAASGVNAAFIRDLAKYRTK